MKLYVETTVPNFLFADDAPEKKAVTEQFYDWLKVCVDELYISELVLAELSRTHLPLRTVNAGSDCAPECKNPSDHARS